MSIDYSASIGIGFIIDRDDLLAPFRVKTKEKFHMEDRFDQKTGKKLSQVKVVDQEAGEAFEFEGETYDDDCGYDLYEAIGKRLNCEISDTGGYTDGETLYVTVDVELTGEDHCDDGRFSTGSSILFDNVVSLKGKLKEVAEMFKSRYGIDLGKPKVFIAYNIS